MKRGIEGKRSSEKQKSFSDDLNFIAARQDCLTSARLRAGFVHIVQTQFDNHPVFAGKYRKIHLFYVVDSSLCGDF